MSRAIQAYLLKRIQEVTNEEIKPTAENMKQTLVFEGILSDYDSMDDKITCGVVLAHQVMSRIAALSDLPVDQEPTGADLWDVLRDLEKQATSAMEIMTEGDQPCGSEPPSS